MSVGDAVTVSGTAIEFRPGGAGSTNLTTTEISSPSVIVNSSGNPLPAPTIIGTGGRIPPAAVIENDASGDVENSGVFDPGSDGIDFYESMEAMRVRIDDAVAVGPEATSAPTAKFQSSATTAQTPVIVRPAAASSSGRRTSTRSASF